MHFIFITDSHFSFFFGWDCNPFVILIQRRFFPFTFEMARQYNENFTNIF